MEIQKAPPPATGPKTEWKQNTKIEEEAPKAVSEESFGTQLNRMSGIQALDKNTFQKKNEMSKEAYLKMVMEQIKFQDPFNPVKNEQFSQQMTALSQLEQQINTNKNLEKISQQQNNMQIAALQLVGKNIMADRATIYHDHDKSSGINFKIPVDVSELNLEIYNINGEKVHTVPVGARSQGDVAAKWDGSTEQGALADSGKYSFKVIAKGMDGKPVEVPTKIDGRVTGVTNSQGVTFLLVGEQRVGLNDIETIKEGVPDAATPTPPGQIPVGVNNVAGTKTETKDKEGAEKSAPQISVADEAAKSLAEDSLGNANMNGLMPIFMR